MVRITVGLVMVCLTMLAVGSLDIASNATPLLNTKSGFAFIPHQVEYARAGNRKDAVYCYAPADTHGRIDLSQSRTVVTTPKAMVLTSVRLQSVQGAGAGAGTEGFFDKAMTGGDFCAYAQTHYRAREVASLF